MLRRLFIGIVLMWAVCAGNAGMAEEMSYAIDWGLGAMLVGAQGEIIAAQGEYGALRALTGADEGVRLYAGRAAEGEEENWALVDGSGAALTGFSYESLEYEGGAVVFMQDGRLGVMDTEGNIRIDAAYTGLTGFGDGAYLATKTDPYDDSADGVYRVDLTGLEASTGVKIIGGLNAVSDGLCAAESAENGLYGYLNAQGEWAIEPAFEWAGGFRDGRAAAASAGGTGLIDLQGNWLVEPKYEYMTWAGEGSLMTAGYEGAADVLHPETYEALAQFEEAEYAFPAEKHAAVVGLSEGVALVNGRGDVQLLAEGRTAVQRQGMDGRIIIQSGDYGADSVCLYRADGTLLAGPYQNILPLGEKDGEMYYICMSFQATQVDYEAYGMSFWDEIPGTRRCGVLSPEGEELCAFETEYITYLGEDRILVRLDGEAALADFAGNILGRYEIQEAEDGAE